MRTFSFSALLILAACVPPPQEAAASANPPVEPPAQTAVASASAPASAASPASASAATHVPGQDKVLDAYLQADVVVVATVRASELSVAERMPPIYNHTLDVRIDRRLSGASLPEQIQILWSADPLHGQPIIEREIPVGERVLVALSREEGSLPERTVSYRAQVLERLTPAREAELAAKLRPAPDGLALRVAQLPGVHAQAPYGDGLFDLRLVNDGAAPIEVPGVWFHDGQALLARALVVRDSHGRTLRLPQTSALPPGAKPLTLAPGASSKLTVDVRPFGMVRAVGGERRHYSFELGPVRTSSWFYYLTDVHGSLTPQR